MKTRETIIRRWFDMWLQESLGLAEMFSESHLIESGQNIICEMFSDNPPTLKAGGRNITALQKSNFGLTNGIPVALCFNGI